MGDPMKNLEIFKRLGFDSYNQWILYDESFQKFYNWFADNITDANILEDNEILEQRTLSKNGEYLKGDTLQKKLKEISLQYPYILEYSDEDTEELIAIVEENTHTENILSNDCKKMEKTKANLIRNLTDIKNEINLLENSVQHLNTSCLEKAQELQECQRTSKKLCSELNDCLTKFQSPPLFIHQMPLDQYYIKCDSFFQYLMLYMRENFKMQDFLEDEAEHDDMLKITKQLDKITKQMSHVEESFIESKIKAIAVRRMNEQLEIDRIHFVSMSQLKKEIRDLELFNEHSSYTYDTLMSEIKIHIKEISQQQAELILYENSKQKLERAVRRLQSVKSLSKIVSDALSNAELLWIFMQFDLEKIKTKCGNMESLNQECQRCSKRIEAMSCLQAISLNSSSNVYVKTLSEIISSYLQTNHNVQPKTIFYEYEKLCRSQNYILKDIISKKFYETVLNTIREIDSKRKVLLYYVFDSPVNAPMFENIKFLEPIFEAKQIKQQIEKSFKHLRTDFLENIQERMSSDRLWEYKQVLWIWFLTEPKKVLNAIQEVSRAASKVSTTAVKSLSGIKRK